MILKATSWQDLGENKMQMNLIDNDDNPMVLPTSIDEIQLYVNGVLSGTFIKCMFQARLPDEKEAGRLVHPHIYSFLNTA